MKEDNLSIKFAESLNGLCDDLISRQEEFCGLDAKAGDGDLGITVTYGCRAIKKYLQRTDAEDASISELLMESGEAWEENTGSTFSIIAAEMFYSAAKRLKGIDVPSAGDIADIFLEMSEAVKKRGKVDLGDKTIYDALKPSSDAFRDEIENGGSVVSGFNKALAAASDASEKTKGLKAKTGRASWMGDKVVDEIDAGSVVWVRILEYIVKEKGIK